jgi:hypothetical protein
VYFVQFRCLTDHRYRDKKVVGVFVRFSGTRPSSGKTIKGKVLAKRLEMWFVTVIYLAHSPRIKFYIKQIPEYVKDDFELNMPLEQALVTLENIYSRKVTGGDATVVLQAILNSVSQDDAYVIERIIDKNLKMVWTGINKIIPKLIEETPYQGAKSFSVKGAMKLFEKGKAVMSKLKLMVHIVTLLSEVVMLN